MAAALAAQAVALAPVKAQDTVTLERTPLADQIEQRHVSFVAHGLSAVGRVVFSGHRA